jgi:hypothetical protein
MDITTFLILSLANWRISSMLSNPDEHGLYEIFDRFRYWIGIRQIMGTEREGQNEIAKLFMCLWCLSIWIGIIQTILWLTIPVYTTWIMIPFALSAVVILFEAKR